MIPARFAPALRRAPTAACGPCNSCPFLTLKVLSALDSTWATMQFEHEPHSRTGIMLLKSDEVLIETLEDNQVQLQNLMASKYLAFFLQEVSGWQQKLSTADSVISILFEVQRTWSHLESIFIGSEDIRSQLPEDSRKFDSIDKDFRVRSPTLPAPQSSLLLQVQPSPFCLAGTNGRCSKNPQCHRSYQQTRSLWQTGGAAEEVGLGHPDEALWRNLTVCSKTKGEVCFPQ